MISIEEMKHRVPRVTEDVHDLQLRLYREIGISAVAAALNVGVERQDTSAELRLTDLPAVLRGDDLAA
jgi:hypothetical protein